MRTYADREGRRVLIPVQMFTYKFFERLIQTLKKKGIQKWAGIAMKSGQRSGAAWKVYHWMKERAVNFHNGRFGTRIAAQISRMIYSTEISIVNTICIRRNMGNLQIRRTIFVVFIGVNYNRWLWNYVKITRFTMFVRGGERVYVKF